jgi:1-phosphatidylinositol-4-phosphate 5-kinase
MDNLFSTNKEIHLRYDLKGSIIGRQELNQNHSLMKYDFGSFALKDLDMDNHNRFLFVGDKKEKIVNQLKNDTEFLRNNNIIDYSLLVGIHIKDHDKNIKSDIPFNVVTNNQNNNQNNIEFKEEKESLNDQSVLQLSENSLLNYDLNYTDNSLQNLSIDKEKHPFKDVRKLLK